MKALRAIPLVLCCACGSGTNTTTNSVSGTVMGTQLAAADAALWVCSEPATSSSAAFQADTILIQDTPGICASISSGMGSPNAHALELVFWSSVPSGTTTPTPATYTIVSQPPGTPGKFAEAFFGSSGTMNGTVSGSAVQATSGSVVIKTIDSSALGAATGTFDLMFGSDHVTGSFHAPFCDVPNQPIPNCP